MQSRKKIIILVVVVALLVLVLGWAAHKAMVAEQSNPAGDSGYAAVYFTTGDIYFGKLSWFPEPHITDVWLLSRNTDTTGQSQLSITPLKNAFWGPVDAIYFNSSQVLFWTYLRNDSQLVKALQ